MNVATAIVVGAALIGGSVAWASERASRDARCAGYLASPNGGEALFRFSIIQSEYRDSERLKASAAAKVIVAGGTDPRDMQAMLAEGREQADAENHYLAGFRLAGCVLNHPQ